MKFFKAICFSCILVLSFAILIIAQTPSTKIGLINRKDFDDKTNGIKEVSDAYDKLDIEFKPQNEQLKAMAQKLQNLEKYIKEISNNYNPRYEAGKEIQKSVDKYDLLACQFLREQEMTKSQFKKREAEILKDTNIKIAEALRQFGKQNGFAIILDKTEENSHILIGGEIIAITKDFIQYYNKKFAEVKTQ
jgi:Skp family chaperone for outer membrane proteins